MKEEIFKYPGVSSGRFSSASCNAQTIPRPHSLLDIPVKASAPDLRATPLHELVDWIIIQRVRRFHGNISRAAESLKISNDTVAKRLVGVDLSDL